MVAIVVVATGWWALAFQSVYSQEHPRIAASRWIYNKVPPGSKITGEIWDDTIPYAIPGEERSYSIVETFPYDTDSTEKVRKLVFGDASNRSAGGLVAADYVAITSNRVRDSVKKLEREYPATNRYYELLETGELGFERVATFKRYLRLAYLPRKALTRATRGFWPAARQRDRVYQRMLEEMAQW